MPALVNLIGKKFGRLKVIKRSDENKRNKPAWVCKCDCGNELTIAGCELRQNETKSCGCLRKEIKIINISGKKFGRLTAIEIVESKGKSTDKFWKCKCECGNYHVASSRHLRLGQVKSCGCFYNKSDAILLEEAKKRFFKNTDKTKTCWNWTGQIVKGYGKIYFKKQMGAHRFSYLIHKDELIDGKLICHTCDNPRCVNPEHLYQGTAKENSKDAYSRKRMIVGEKHHYAKLKLEEVKYILSCKEKGVHLAKKFNVAEDTISRIRTRKMWKDI